jgi:hypothetical protein
MIKVKKNSEQKNLEELKLLTIFYIHKLNWSEGNHCHKVIFISYNECTLIFMYSGFQQHLPSKQVLNTHFQDILNCQCLLEDRCQTIEAFILGLIFFLFHMTFGIFSCSQTWIHTDSWDHAKDSDSVLGESLDITVF